LYDITLQGNTTPWDLNSLYLMNNKGNRISLGAVAEMIPTIGPSKLFHYNQMRSVTISTDLPAKMSLEEGMENFLQEVKKNLPINYRTTWTGAAKAFDASQNTITLLFVLSILFIYAILAIQFENFSDPFIILLTVPLACFGGLGLVWINGGSFNIYTQIGLVTLIGLITKHGILIVEFVNQLREKNDLHTAIVQAASLRLRPILMTTGAMVFGIIPLVFSKNAGHEAMHAMGVMLIGGLVVGTFFTLYVLPTMCYMIKAIDFGNAAR
jgi:multidrug efflux pump